MCRLLDIHVYAVQEMAGIAGTSQSMAFSKAQKHVAETHQQVHVAMEEFQGHAREHGCSAEQPRPM
jgi:hypothetical protein